jgi:uncharacterized membrane protein YedE/YeeE
VQIDWSNFTPISALIGGVLIGTAAVLFALLAGRIAGVSGVVGGLLPPKANDVSWRVAFVAGLIAAPLAYSLFTAIPPIEVEATYPMLVIVGLLVGIGTRYSSGCTSGHGVCGLSRRSPRSFIATLTFMAAAFITVFLLRHVLGH